MMERGKYLSWVFHRIFFCLVVSTWTSPRLKNHDLKQKKKLDFESLFLSMDLSFGRYLAENLFFSSLHCYLDRLDFSPSLWQDLCYVSFFASVCTVTSRQLATGQNPALCLFLG